MEFVGSLGCHFFLLDHAPGDSHLNLPSILLCHQKLKKGWHVLIAR